jgi:hypothetical protein
MLLGVSGFVVCAATIVGSIELEVARRRLLAACCLPLLVSIALFGLAGTSSRKWCWPWVSAGHQLLRMHADARRAAERLGLPRDRYLTPEEYERLARATPLSLEVRFPIIRTTVIANIYDIREPAKAQLRWPGRQYGTLELRSMRITHVYD